MEITIFFLWIKSNYFAPYNNPKRVYFQSSLRRCQFLTFFCKYNLPRLQPSRHVTDLKIFKNEENLKSDFIIYK